MKVRAIATITEKNFAGKKLHTHARPSDTGQVVWIDEDTGFVSVRFDRTGTVTVVDVGREVVPEFVAA